MRKTRELCDAFDLDAYVIDHGGVEIQTGEWLLVCPMCGKRKLAVNPHKRVWHCWIDEEYGPPDVHGKRQVVRGAGGVLQLVMLLEGLDISGALHFVQTRQLFNPLDTRQVRAQLYAPVRECTSTVASPIPYPDHWHDIDVTMAYMVQRGITLQDAQAFRLGWCSDGRYRNRLMFPVYENGRLMYYQGRAMWDPQPGEHYIKTLNPPKTPGASVSSDVLMNLDQACKHDEVVVTEGPIDCVHVGLDAVCSFGKKLHPRQIAKLIEAGVRKVVLMWDGPTAREPRGAWPEMFQTASVLDGAFDVRLVFLPAGDPGDYTREQLNVYRAQARRADEFAHVL